MSDRWVRVAVHAAPGQEEIVRARLLDLAPGGLEEVDRPDGLELAVFTPVDGVGRVTEAFPTAVTTEVPSGWEDGWRSFHRPIVVAGIWIGPPWETAPDDRPAVVVDPGRAFGTGAHATTRLCVELLAGLPRGSMLDVGCGSGVLAIAAAAIGFAPVVAVDVDPTAVEATRANAAANGVTVDARLLDAERDLLPASDVAVANVLLSPVEVILCRLHAHHAVTSGYVAGERPRHPGWAHARTVELDGWAADLFTRETV